MRKKRKILIVIEHYFPGFKDGGPVRSVMNLVQHLCTEYDIYILTKDRDQGDSIAYSGITSNMWNEVRGVKVWYASPASFSEETIYQLAQNMDTVYVCGCFGDHARTILKLKKYGKISARVIIASMGLFSPGAYSIKKTKKQIYMSVLKITRLLKQVEWSASNEQEVSDIRRVVGKKAICNIAEDLPQVFERKYEHNSSEKEHLKIIFLARISPKKNLKYTMEILKGVKGNIVFDIYGNAEDNVYFNDCMMLAKTLPTNIMINYKGEVSPEHVLDTLSKYDIFLFPTLGENFGHVIIEAMGAGCIPVITDTTPWNDLDEKGAGNVIPLQDKNQFVNIIEKYVDMTSNELKELSDKSYQYAVTRDITNAVNGYRKMFDRE